MSCLENLPNELFEYIFQYFDLAELNESFYELNSRFRSLLESCSATHVWVRSNLSPEFISRFATRIQSLHIKNCQHRISLAPLASSLIKLVLGSSINLSYDELSLLENLQYLDCVKDNICNNVSRQTKLQHLGIQYCHFENKHDRFSLLKSLCLYDAHGKYVFDKIIVDLPHLTALQIHDHYNKEYPSIPLNQIRTFPMITNFRLYLRNGFHQTQIDWYFGHLPNIKLFHIEYFPCLVYHSWDGPYALLNFIAAAIEKYLHNLRRFSCLAACEIQHNLPFDMTKIHSIYQENHVEIYRNDNRLFEFYSKKNFV